jgi:tRNA (uracil-5-)-methyltransferase
MTNIQRLIYVSCDPMAASKNFVDLCRPTSNKYDGDPFKLKSIVPIDMFPQTKLCEWVMLFEKWLFEDLVVDFW